MDVGWEGEVEDGTVSGRRCVYTRTQRMRLGLMACKYNCMEETYNDDLKFEVGFHFRGEF